VNEKHKSNLQSCGHAELRKGFHPILIISRIAVFHSDGLEVRSAVKRYDSD
jgi:hypothetical protein